MFTHIYKRVVHAGIGFDGTYDYHMTNGDAGLGKSWGRKIEDFGPTHDQPHIPHSESKACYVDKPLSHGPWVSLWKTNIDPENVNG